MIRLIATLLLAAFVTGCSTTPAVPESMGEDTISGITMGCKKPYLLTQDCSVWTGAKRSIELEGFPVKVGASEDGKTVFIMDAKLFSNAFKEGFTMNLSEDYQTVAANNSFEAVQKVFLDRGVRIERVRPIVTMGRVNGYVLELDSDGYSVLKEFTVR